MSFWEVTLFLWDGFLISLLIFAVTLLCGIPLGLPIAFCSMSRLKPLKAVKYKNKTSCGRVKSH